MSLKLPKLVKERVLCVQAFFCLNANVDSKESTLKIACHPSRSVHEYNRCIKLTIQKISQNLLMSLIIVYNYRISLQLNFTEISAVFRKIGEGK